MSRGRVTGAIRPVTTRTVVVEEFAYATSARFLRGSVLRKLCSRVETNQKHRRQKQNESDDDWPRGALVHFRRRFAPYHHSPEPRTNS